MIATQDNERFTFRASRCGYRDAKRVSRNALRYAHRGTWNENELNMAIRQYIYSVIACDKERTIDIIELTQNPP